MDPPKISYLPDYPRGKLFESVYPPSDDSFLLADALVQRLDRFPQNATFCEIGPGSGVVMETLRWALERDKQSAVMIGIDTNPMALQSTKYTSAGCHLVQADARAWPFRAGTVDVIFWNPPYVTTATDEVDADDLARTYAGGVCGSAPLETFLSKVRRLLKPGGRFLFLAERKNVPQELVREVEGIRAECIGRRGICGEFLSVWDLQPK